MNLPPPDADQTVAEAEGLLDRLLTEASHGLVSDVELRSLLPRLRWRGPDGGRYTLGINSRTWFAWDGTEWIPGVPPAMLRIDLDPELEPDVDPMSPLENASTEPTAAGAGWNPTHRTPDAGLQSWAAPDPATAVTPVGGGLPVQVVETWGDWARVVFSNGWSGWVDARLLGPLA